MKARISATVDPETRKIIDKAMDSGRYRNLSHFIEDLIKGWKSEGKAK